jgi:hypothetical protein
VEVAFANYIYSHLASYHTSRPLPCWDGYTKAIADVRVDSALVVPPISADPSCIQRPELLPPPNVKYGYTTNAAALCPFHRQLITPRLDHTTTKEFVTEYDALLQNHAKSTYKCIEAVSTPLLVFCKVRWGVSYKTSRR